MVVDASIEGAMFNLRERGAGRETGSGVHGRTV